MYVKRVLQKVPLGSWHFLLPNYHCNSRVCAKICLCPPKKKERVPSAEVLLQIKQFYTLSLFIKKNAQSC